MESSVTILNYNGGVTIEIKPAVSLLNNFLRNGIPIDTVCGGRAQCGRCILRIVEGKDKLSPVRERERLKLKELHAGENFRLACQSYSRGKVSVEIINFKNNNP